MRDFIDTIFHCYLVIGLLVGVWGVVRVGIDRTRGESFTARVLLNAFCIVFYSVFWPTIIDEVLWDLMNPE